MADRRSSWASTSAPAASRRSWSTLAGDVQATATTPLALPTPQPGLGGAGPGALVAGDHRVDSRRARADVPVPQRGGIGISGQMHSSVFLDREGEVIRPALLWCDGRTTAECAEITRARRRRGEAARLGVQPGARRVHAAQGALAAEPRAGGVRAAGHGAAGQGLHSVPADRRAGDRAVGRVGHADVRSGAPALERRRSCDAVGLSTDAAARRRRVGRGAGPRHRRRPRR